MLDWLNLHSYMYRHSYMYLHVCSIYRFFQYLGQLWVYGGTEEMPLMNWLYTWMKRWHTHTHTHTHTLTHTYTLSILLLHLDSPHSSLDPDKVRAYGSMQTKVTNSLQIICKQLQKAYNPLQRACGPLRRADSCEPQPFCYITVQIFVNLVREPVALHHLGLDLRMYCMYLF